MLQNQTFVDPQLALNIQLLEKQMNSLIHQKLQIQYNTQFLDQKKRALMLQANEDQRLQLRQIIEKSKLAMVDYFDTQVQVVSIDCLKKGSVQRKSKEKFQITKIQQKNQTPTLSYDQNDSEKSSRSNTHERFKQSRNSLSTNYKSKIYHCQDHQGDRSLNNFNSFYESTQEGDQSSDSRSSDPKERNSILSTGLRMSHGAKEFRVSCRQKNRVKDFMSSEGLNGSVIENKNNGSSIMEINEFNITSTSIPPLAISKPLPYPNADSSVAHYLEHQPLREDNESSELISLFQAKVTCLEQKCISLEKKNSELIKVIEYQQDTIHELDQVIQMKEKEIEQLSFKWNQNLNFWKGKATEVEGNLKQIIGQIEKYKEKICLSINANQIISKYRNFQSPVDHLPVTLNPGFQISSQSHILTDNFEQNMTDESQKQNQKGQIISLGKQLIQMQQRLKQIEDENEQLKGQRRLLLRKVKV